MHVVGQDDWEKKAILMHCREAKMMDHLVPAFLFCKYQVFMIDPPGYG